MKLLHVAPIDGRLGSGLTYAIPALINAQQRAGAEVKMLASGLDPEPIINAEYPIIWKRELRHLGTSGLDELADWADLVIFHSTYIPYHWKVSRIAKRHRVPMVIVPHGGMTALAGQIKRLKKVIGNYFFLNGIVRSCQAIHFLSDNEAHSSRHWKLPSFVVPNGVNLPAMIERTRSGGEEVNLVFIGRISMIHKGLDLLLEAIRVVLLRGDLPRFVLNMYGPGIPRDVRRLKKLITEKSLHSHVKLHAPVYGQAKSDVLSRADVFVLTSRFEGHPMAVLEALAHGVPCLVSSGTNMSSEIQEAGAGWACSGHSDSIVGALKNALRARKKIPQFGQAARHLAKYYSWESIAKRTLQEYRGILNEYST
jgi:glycosyltransferase involved in cell wall biosynthesis